jgi:hypothetical protein
MIKAVITLSAGTIMTMSGICTGIFSAVSPALATVTPPADSAPAAAAIDKQIGAYEEKFFERTFDGESEKRRLDRLDTFIFGATNPGSAPVRIALIARVVQVNTPPPEAKPATTSGGTKPSPGTQSQTTGQSSHGAAASPEPALQSPGNYPHITALEAKILGNTFTDQPLTERLSRLETKAFGAPSNSNDLEERNMQAKHRPKDMTIGMPLEDEDIAPMSPEIERRYQSADEDPGSVVHHQTIEQELADAQKTTPPTKDERTLSRIAWCEQQLFGHAYPEMHLLKRLHQLNHELFPQDKEPDIQLMDRIDKIVREVVLRKQPHQPTQT